MIRRSNHTRALAFSELIPRAQAETDAFDEAAAAVLGLNRTDVRCLGMILEHDAATPSRLAEEMKLTRGAMTTALDRLEAAGFARRVKDPADRRGVRVEATARARKAVDRIWEPLRAAGLELLDGYSDAELATLERFFEQYCQLQRTHAARVRALRRR